MRVLVAGAGRSGTCLLTEVVRGLEVVRFSKAVEDRRFFNYKTLPENYGTKNATEPEYFTPESIMQLMELYSDLRLIFSARHPVDICLSKIKRAEGVEDKAVDGTVEKAVFYVMKAYQIKKAMINFFSERTLIVKFESLLMFPFREILRVADWFGVSLTDNALNFYKHNRNRYHRERYGRMIDLLQIGTHARPEIAYDGYFKDRLDDIEKMKKELEDEIRFHSSL